MIHTITLYCHDSKTNDKTNDGLFLLMNIADQTEHREKSLVSCVCASAASSSAVRSKSYHLIFLQLNNAI